MSTLNDVPPTVSSTLNIFPAVGETVTFPPAAVFVIVLSFVSTLPEDFKAMLISPPVAVIVAPPKLIVVPERYKSLKRLVVEPKSYTSF